jgi:hypothetical protein
MLSFEIAGGDDNVRKFVESVEIITWAESLGGVESLIAHPATMTLAGMSPKARRVAGISDGLLRLSIGLESETDFLSDIATGFAALNRQEQSAGDRSQDDELVGRRTSCRAVSNVIIARTSNFTISRMI